jgi:penicillin amidase
MRQWGDLCKIALAVAWMFVLGVASPREPPKQNPARADLPQIGDGPRSTVKVAGLRSPVGIYFDRFGIPHIYANSTEDAYFALGYLHATHRLLQMELARRRAAGSMAEVFGPDRLDEDVFIRRVGVQRSAEAAWRSPEIYTKVKIEVVAYCAGVNARWRELDPRKLPEPLRNLDSGPRSWTPVDALSLMKFMAWQWAGAAQELRRGLLIEKLGARTVEELYGIPAARDDATAKPDSNPATAIMPRGFAIAADTILSLLQKSGVGDEGVFGGNGWIVNGRISATGKPMLANDLQGELTLPSPWYAAHLTAPNLNVVGATLPGFPFVLAGRNPRIAWGLTRTRTAALDFFVEKTDPSRPHEYFHEGDWRPTSRRVERFQVRGDNPVQAEMESTVHGPVFTAGGVALALAWAGAKPTYEVNFFQGLNQAGNLDDFKAAIAHLSVPAMNILYADADGNIALATRGAIPVRKTGHGGWPVDGSSGNYDWKGFLPAARLPLILNPGENYLASIGDSTLPADYARGSGWKLEPSWRARRLRDLLGQHDPLTLEQFQRSQLDVSDPAAATFVPILLAAYERKPFGGQQVREAVDELRRWNFEVTPESVAQTIWWMWCNELHAARWRDRLRALRAAPASEESNPTDMHDDALSPEILRLLTHDRFGASPPDDTGALPNAIRDQVVARTFTSAINQLVRERGEKKDDWRWGRVNILSLRSLPPDVATERRPLPLRGDAFTLWRGGHGAPVTAGATWRMVIDLGNPEQSFAVNAGGQSEDPARRHYDDQVKFWVDGQYLPLYSYPAPGELRPSQIESQLILEPEG